MLSHDAIRLLLMFSSSKLSWSKTFLVFLVNLTNLVYISYAIHGKLRVQTQII